VGYHDPAKIRPEVKRKKTLLKKKLPRQQKVMSPKKLRIQKEKKGEACQK